MDLGKSIKIALINRGMTQSELAERLGVSDGYISNLATGSRFPGRNQIEKLANELGYKVSEFIALGE